MPIAPLATGIFQYMKVVIPVSLYPDAKNNDAALFSKSEILDLAALQMAYEGALVS